MCKCISDNQNEPTKTTDNQAEISKSVAFIAAQYDTLLEKINALEKEKGEDLRRIKQLEDRVEYLERKGKACTIEIRNTPIITQENAKYETKEDLCNLVEKLGTTISVEIKQTDIKEVYRMNPKKDQSQPIILEFCSELKKQKTMDAVKKFNKNKSNNEKLNATHLDPTLPKKPIFVSESLTQKTQHLFYLARAFAKDNGYAFCWTSHGGIFLRKAEELPHIKINSEAQLLSLRNVA